jgi:hypothetical protein
MRSSEAATTQIDPQQLVEVSFPAWPSPVWMARAVAPAAPRTWATQRDAGAAAAAVAVAVVVPALVAAGAVVSLFVLTSAVLVAPLVAVVLAWVAWRCNEVGPAGATPSAHHALAPRGAGPPAR